MCRCRHLYMLLKKGQVEQSGFAGDLTAKLHHSLPMLLNFFRRGFEMGDAGYRLGKF